MVVLAGAESKKRVVFTIFVDRKGVVTERKDRPLDAGLSGPTHVTWIH